MIVSGSARGQEPATGPAAGEVPVPAEVVRVIELPAPDGWPDRELPPLTREEVARLQVALALAGFDPGAHHGRLDRATARALEAFQRRAGLEPCGCPTLETVEALGIPLLHILRLSGPPPPEPVPPTGERADEGGRETYTATPTEPGGWAYGWPVVLHRRVELGPPEPTPIRNVPDRAGVRPPGVRPAPPDPRAFGRGR